MTGKRPRVTISTIAREVGVTHGTVSRALRGDPRVKAETTARIQAAAERLGYVPNRMGKGLRLQRSHTLGVIMPEVSDPFFSEVLHAIHDTVVPAGYSLFVTSEGGDPRRAVKALWEQQVDGLFVACLTTWRPSRSDMPFPYVVLNDHLGGAERCAVSTDDAGGVRACVEHLAALGHRRIAYMGNGRAAEIDGIRRAAFLAAVKQAGLKAPERELPQAPGGDPSAGWDATRRWWPGSKATALLCFNDQMALGALRALREADVDVPGELSVVGFDDLEVAAYTAPPLTTYSQPKTQLGREAARILLAILDGEAPPEAPRTLQGALVVRGSTAPPAR